MSSPNTVIPSTSSSPPPREAPPSFPPRRNILHPIPNSAISLDIILNESKPLAPSVITTTLSRAMAEARKNPPSGFVEGVFRFPHEQEQGEQTEGRAGDDGAEFGIVGGLFTQELTWGDVVTVLQGLEGFYEGESGGCWVAMIFYMQDEARGSLGSGSLQARTGVTV
ncbi:hypothetical protein MMC07_009534 [Pseudocyphellaria aurata]|nr:hypothetical protein [Pseudocyphellaria aurata]